jgi:hypothetical protein
LQGQYAEMAFQTFFSKTATSARRTEAYCITPQDGKIQLDYLNSDSEIEAASNRQLGPCAVALGKTSNPDSRRRVAKGRTDGIPLEMASLRSSNV